MKVVFQLACVYLFAQVAFAAQGPVKDEVCDKVCPPDFPINANWHLPYEGDCTKFCHCANDGNWKKDCPANLHFNKDLQVCDWPENAKCEGGGASPSDPDPSTNGCDHMTCADDECKTGPSDNDCNEYCRCDHGTVTNHHCSAGLWFNPVTKNCDWQSNVDCKVTEAPISSTTTSTTTSTPTTASTTTTSAPVKNICENICPAIYPIVANNHLPIPGVCTQFCHCANDGDHLKDCAPGTWFNAALQVCDWPANSGCVEK